MLHIYMHIDYMYMRSMTHTYNCCTTWQITCNAWVKSAKIQYRLNIGDELIEMPEVFTCNVVGDVTETITNIFDSPIYARYVRILPQSGASMRAGLVVLSPDLPVFSIPVTISSVSPTNGGFGGVYNVTIQGDGFNSDRRRVAVKLCGFPCAVTFSSSSEITCVPTEGFAHVPLQPTVSSMLDIPVKDGADDATQDRDSHAFIISNAMLSGYNAPNTWDNSIQYVLVRFRVDVVQGVKLSKALLQFKSSDASCPMGAVITIYVEATDNSEPFDPAVSDPRTKSENYVEWITTEDWRFGESKETSDISILVNEVVARPGWRAGNFMSFILLQRASQNGMVRTCNMLSFDYDRKYAPRLQLQLASAPSTSPVPSVDASRECDVVVTVTADQSDPSIRCPAVRLRVAAIASSADVPSTTLALDTGHENDIRGLYKSILYKDGNQLSWKDARERCSAVGARLCRKHEIMEDGVPFFGFQDAVNGYHIHVPTEFLVGGYLPGLTHSDSWIDVSREVPVDVRGQGDALYPSWEGNGAENQQRTSIIPCCSIVGHPPYMAVDDFTDSFWNSREVMEANMTLAVEHLAETVERIQILWTADYASEYRVLIRNLDEAWTILKHEKEGDGDMADVELSTPLLVGSGLQVRVEMHRRAHGRARYGIKDIELRGCRLAGNLLTATSNATVGGSPLFTLEEALTPTVASVHPSRGTTAGGSDVTIVGRFFTAEHKHLSVTFGSFPCLIQSVSSISADAQKIECVTSASGILHGGLKYVTVLVRSAGRSVRTTNNATFWYIDTWGSRTTWGGKQPPTGCGSFVDDRTCTDTVYIPEGQMVLLDQSLPRFYLLLIEGTLIFDRTDIELSASYILIRGGTLQIGTETEPFTHQVRITMHGHPKSIELPTFGSKVIACYECKLDMHGLPTVAWTRLTATAWPGDSEIRLLDPVAWPVGSRIVIATTDFESPESSHTEVASVAAVLDQGHRVQIKDIRVCPRFTFSGQPLDCTVKNHLTFMHLGETRTVEGRELHFRAEVGLLSRNIVIQGDHDGILCPNAAIADDGVTKLSCNEFGAQLFFHSPGHESLRARLSNVEVRNGGQAFRLGKYAIHWHMIGNVRQSFQRNCSVHHSWNRGVAIHGVNHLRLQHNMAYSCRGHTFFIEDGPEEHNRIEYNLAVKTIPSMALLNTDQTPAGFWIVSCKQYIRYNHAVASRRYGLWIRPEISATGTSVNTPDVHPINIPILEFRGNQAHSNGKYGLRIFDVFLPNQASIVHDLFVWRNGMVGWTATKVGRLGLDGVVSVQHGETHFEGRSTETTRWDENFLRNALLIDTLHLPLTQSYAAAHDSFQALDVLGGPMKGGLLLPWNELAGGMTLTNVTFVNHWNFVLRGAAHVGRGGSPSTGDGGFETRFEGIKFVNTSRIALFRHPQEAFFYDLDGSLTGSGIREDYTRGGSVKGSSLVPRSILLPPNKCTPFGDMPVEPARRLLGSGGAAEQGVGGMMCQGLVFRRVVLHVTQPAHLIGKSMCVRPGWSSHVTRCSTRLAECNCIPIQKKWWGGNVFLAAVGYRYTLELDLLDYEKADIEQWDVAAWDLQPGERILLTYRFLRWLVADDFGRPLFHLRSSTHPGSKGKQYYMPSVWAASPVLSWLSPVNYQANQSACDVSTGFCGKVEVIKDWQSKEYDVLGTWEAGVASGGDIPVPKPDQGNHAFTVKKDLAGDAALVTMLLTNEDNHAKHIAGEFWVKNCPQAGCWPPPPPPQPTEQASALYEKWSSPKTWLNLTRHVNNPLNTIVLDQAATSAAGGTPVYQMAEAQEWSAPIPSAFDNVWIPLWKKVVLGTHTHNHTHTHSLSLSLSLSLSHTHTHTCTKWTHSTEPVLSLRCATCVWVRARVCACMCVGACAQTSSLSGARSRCVHSRIGPCHRGGLPGHQRFEHDRHDCHIHRDQGRFIHHRAV